MSTETTIEQRIDNATGTLTYISEGEDQTVSVQFSLIEKREEVAGIPRPRTRITGTITFGEMAEGLRAAQGSDHTLKYGNAAQHSIVIGPSMGARTFRFTRR